jgi:predicted PhzF superfamily epimerase YddE/YHI9
MKYEFYIVDVFSDEAFKGNQLAILPNAAGISTEGMQKIAREFNFAETTFVLPKAILKARASFASSRQRRNSTLPDIPRSAPHVRWL